MLAQRPPSWRDWTSGPRRGVQTDGGARPEMGTESASEGCGAPPLRARAAGKNAAFELLEADFKAFVSEINLGVDLTWY